MLTRSILLGGAIALALAGAGFAQQASDKTLTDQTQPMDKAQSTDQAQSDQTTAKTVHHNRHHVRHHIRTAMLHRHTGMTHRPSTPTERRATAQLNQQQLQMAGPQYAQSGPQNGAYPTERGQNNGVTPGNKLPNGNPYQTATPGGGKDLPAVEHPQPR